MCKQETAKELKAYAEYLRRTRLPVGEKEAIERILNCSVCLEKLAKELEEDEADNQQGE
ncbi:MAG: hypothetical protein IKY90_07135 [Oscillospiraceae bacterium]|nr:hypothetical protein [Oscillospiraceae bacterium]